MISLVKLHYFCAGGLFWFMVAQVLVNNNYWLGAMDLLLLLLNLFMGEYYSRKVSST